MKENLSESRTVRLSSNDESDDGVEKSSRKQAGTSRPTTSVSSSKYDQCEEESTIVWSDSDDGFGAKSGLDAEFELDLFLAEIEKDFRRTNKIKQITSMKKLNFLDNSLAAIEGGKADRVFLDYEHRAGILKGLNVVIMETELSYGICTALVKLEDGSLCCFLLYELTPSVKVGRNLVSFVDTSKYYMINGHHIFVQPNKVVEA